MAAKVIVLQGACSSRNQIVVNAVAASLRRLNRSSIKYLETDIASLGQWDSPSTIIISPTPILEKFQGHIEPLPQAYVGMLSEQNLDSILARCFKTIGS